LAGQLLVALHAPAAAAMVWLLARRLASPRAARFAAVVYLSTPWIYRIATIPYVEGPLCYYHAAIAWSIARAWGEAEPSRRARLWGVIGLLAGGAMACKYPALVSAVVPAGAAALVATWRRRSWPIVVAFSIGLAAAIGPWLLKNVIDTRNPVYPLAYGLFDGRHWAPDLDLKWSNAHGRKPITPSELAGAVVDVAGRSDWQSPLFAMLAPLALLRPGSRRGALLLWGYVLYLFATWWLLTHRLDRFWLPLLPAAAVLAGLGADWSRGRGWSALLGGMLAIAVGANLVFDSSSLAGFNQWTTGYDVLRDRVPAAISPALTLVDLSLPPDARLLSVAQAGVFHMRHPIVYNTVFNRETIELIARGRTPDEVRRALHDRGITHLYVDWAEVRRYRSPGNYGFTDFVTPDLFAELRRAGVLEPMPLATPEALARLKAVGYPVDLRRLPQELYRVR
jgi:4-amino-4-deoxy-L-arabinose transferase-like glycosyltransferase